MRRHRSPGTLPWTGSAPHTLARRSPWASRPDEACLLPFVIVLIAVKSDHLLPPSAALGGPSQPSQLFGASQSLGRGEAEVGRCMEAARLRDFSSAVGDRRLSHHAGDTGHQLAQTLRYHPAARAVEPSGPGVGGIEQVLGEGDRDTYQFAHTLSYSV